MLCNERWIDTHSRVFQLALLNEETIAFSTRYHGASLYNTKEKKLLSHITHKHLNSQTIATTFSPNGRFIAFASPHVIYVLETQTSAPLQKISLANHGISTLFFDPDSHYLIVGTQDGRVLQYRIYTNSLLSRLCSFDTSTSKRAVESFASFHNLLGCGAQNGTILVINLYAKANKIKIQAGHKAIKTLHFLDEDTLLSGDAEGVLTLHKFKEQTKVQNIHTPLEQISQILCIKESEYLLVHGGGYEIALIDSNKKKVIQAKFIQTSSPIEKIILAGEDLFIAQSDSTLTRVNILSTDALYSAMLHNTLDEAYTLIEHNPLLQTTHYYKQLQERYKIAYTSALAAFQKRNKAEVLEYLQPYQKIKQTQEEVKLFLKAFDNYERFCDLCREEKYALAYALSTKYPLLRHLPPYQKMEQHWRQTLQQAQKHIIAGKINDAKELLHPFITVSQKRDIVKLILQENTLFLSFLKACESQNFFQATQLAQKHTLVKKLPNYLALEVLMQEKLTSIAKELKKGHVEKAEEMLLSLHGVTELQEELESLQRDCIALRELQRAYEHNDFARCYEILDTNLSLHTSQLALLLEKHWTKMIARCEEYALDANITQIKNTLGELLTLPSRLEKIGDILRLSFQRKITHLLDARMYHNAQNIIYSYIDIFGIDSEILEHMKHYEALAEKKLAITHEQDARGQRDSWIYSSIVG
jgi:hypothetical protein